MSPFTKKFANFIPVLLMACAHAESIANAADASPVIAPATATGAVVDVADKVSAELYGYLKFDASYDSSQAAIGDYFRSVVSNSQNLRGSNQFNATANQSRVGINIKGPETSGAKLTGKLEFDFYNDNAGADNKPVPMMRHAYIEMNWPEEDFSILAGQTWDVINPLFPTTLNYFAGWFAGNDGYRRPQLRLTKGFRMAGDSKITSQLAAGKTVGADTVRPFGATINNDGNDAQYPNVQARVAAQGSLLGAQPSVLGISGHYGREKYYTGGTTVNGVTTGATTFTRVPTWSAGGDLFVPLLDNLTLSGEFLRGQNLASFVGGIGVPVAVTAGVPHGIHATDFWAQLGYKLRSNWQFNVGGGQSKNDSSDLVAATDAKRNSFVFGNTIYNLSKPLSLGFEFTQIATDYLGVPGGRDMRYQTSLQLAF
ncbi:MAG: hypothetical protein H7222_11550 [Methylotenera sp.]|nr:hypothetical protein [Oligoflexia bacterium]